MALGRTRFLAVRSADPAVALLAELGYLAPARSFDVAEVGLPGVSRAQYLRSDLKSKRRAASGQGRLESGSARLAGEGADG